MSLHRFCSVSSDNIELQLILVGFQFVKARDGNPGGRKRGGVTAPNETSGGDESMISVLLQ